MKNVLTPARTAIASVLIVGLAITAQGQTEFRRTLDEGERATRRAGTVQEQINQIDDERSDIVRQFQDLLERKENAESFVSRQRAVVDGQLAEIASFEDQLTRVDEITAQMIPMMQDMITDLRAFVEADLPFKKELRTKRLADLDAALTNASVTAPEAYRLIIEAYQAEMEYGSTVDTWQETVTIGENEVNVDMFQYGRLALVYLTKDQKKAARYNRETGIWEDLPSSYNADIRQAIRIADEKAPPAIMPAPIKKLVLIDQ